MRWLFLALTITIFLLSTSCSSVNQTKLPIAAKLTISEMRPLSLDDFQTQIQQRQINEVLLSGLGLLEARNISIKQTHGTKGVMLVEVLNNDLLDDSVKSIYYRFKLVKISQQHWQLEQAELAHLCRRSGSNEFSNTLCR